jgi:hypothetical protein
LGGVGAFGVVAFVQELAVTPGDFLANADLIDYTVGASEKDEEEAIVLRARWRTDDGIGLVGQPINLVQLPERLFAGRRGFQGAAL